jgi:hypothetical protein
MRGVSLADPGSVAHPSLYLIIQMWLLCLPSGQTYCQYHLLTRLQGKAYDSNEHHEDRTSIKFSVERVWQHKVLHMNYMTSGGSVRTRISRIRYLMLTESELEPKAEPRSEND